jgi:hypothetical protein
VCGAVVEGSEEELLEAVERHIAEAHVAARRDQRAQLPLGRGITCSEGKSTAETEET